MTHFTIHGNSWLLYKWWKKKIVKWQEYAGGNNTVGFAFWRVFSQLENWSIFRTKFYKFNSFPNSKLFLNPFLGPCFSRHFQSQKSHVYKQTKSKQTIMPKYVKNSLIKTNYFSYLQNLDHDLRQQQHTGKVQKWSNSISVRSSNCFLLKWFRCRALKFSSATDRVSSATIHEKSDNTERHRPMLSEGASARSRLSRHLCTQ